ncbi:hypothetical protein [Chromobacterium phragmitis]|uniref:Uncharacterized protein n=1 Tax=Chromobacterium phragmitis TaxID=2202141 RepID=A0A344UL00_9NEIS|nr:hypothetical protein [Chromobacterium phragmitis]AXE35948.1 hypothetical protein DK843_17520 [Chromobacterium phragmitis]
MNKSLIATYSPDDDRLRIYARGTLSAPLCSMLADQGFQLLPDAMVFVSDGWSRPQEKTLLQLCGIVEDDAVWHGDLYLPYVEHLPCRDLPLGTGLWYDPRYWQVRAAAMAGRRHPEEKLLLPMRLARIPLLRRRIAGLEARLRPEEKSPAGPPRGWSDAQLTLCRLRLQLVYCQRFLQEARQAA